MRRIGIGHGVMTSRNIDYRLVVDNAPALVFSARPDGYVDYFNQQWLDCLGVSLEDLEGDRWTRFIHPDDLEEHLRRWREAMSSGQTPVSQARVRMASGEYRWMLHRTQPLRDADGNIVRCIVAAVRLRREIQGEWALGLSGALSVLFGLMVFVSPGAGALAVLGLIAAYAIAFGVLLVVLGFRLRSYGTRHLATV